MSMYGYAWLDVYGYVWSCMGSFKRVRFLDASAQPSSGSDSPLIVLHGLRRAARWSRSPSGSISSFKTGFRVFRVTPHTQRLALLDTFGWNVSGIEDCIFVLCNPMYFTGRELRE